MRSNSELFNIAIQILNKITYRVMAAFKLFCFLGPPKTISHFRGNNNIFVDLKSVKEKRVGDSLGKGEGAWTKRLKAVIYFTAKSQNVLRRKSTNKKCKILIYIGSKPQWSLFQQNWIKMLFIFLFLLHKYL